MTDGPDDEQPPGWASILTVAVGAPVAAVPPVWAVAAFADGDLVRGAALLLLALVGVAEVVVGTRLRHGRPTTTATALVLDFTLVVSGVVVIVAGDHRRSGLLLGLAGTLLLLLLPLEHRGQAPRRRSGGASTAGG